MLLPVLALALLGQTAPKTVSVPGKQPPYATAVQGVTGGVPVNVTGTFTSSGAGDTVGTTSSLNALAASCSVALAGQGGVGMFLAAGTLTGTLTPEYSNDNGTTWTATSFIDTSGTKTSTTVLTNPNAATQLGIVVLGGARQIRVRVSAFTSGAASCTLVATASTSQGAAGGGGGTVSQGGAPWTQRLQDGAGATLATVTAGNALKVDGSAVTQPISASSLPLPSGAATAAKQPALGTAGSASTDVLSVQGIASMTALKVDGSAVTQPVSASSLPLPSGAATSAKQPALGSAGTAATDVLTVQGIASMTALKVDGSAVTQPVSASSLPLPSGASTSAKQPALGTAGSASTDVLTVQGISSMTALKVDGSAVTQPVSGTVTANAGSGTFTTSDTHTTAAAPLSCRLTDGSAFYTAGGGGGGGTSSNFGSAFPTPGTAAGFTDGTNMQGALVFDADTGAGTQYIQGALLKKPASGGAVDFGTSSDPIRVDPTGTTTQPVSGTVTANQGGSNWSVNAAQLAGTAAAVNNGTASAGTLRVAIASDNTANSNPWLVSGAGADAATSVGNPVRAAAIGRANGAAPSAVTAGQTSNLTTDLEHRLWVQTNHPNTFSCLQDSVSAVTQCQAAPGSNSLYITDITLSASAAINIDIVSGTGTNCATGTTQIVPKMYFNANAGLTKTFASPLKVAATSAICCRPSGASGSCLIEGYTAP